MSNGNPEQERAERAVEFCRNNRGSIAGLAATFAAEEVALAVADYRKAIKLMMGREFGIPWPRVPDADVDSWLKAARELDERGRR